MSKRGKIKRMLLGLLPLLLLTYYSRAQKMVDSDHSLLEAAIDSIAQAGLEANAYPGVQVYIAKDGVGILNKSYGFHTDAQERPVQNNHLYDLASITKVSTGLPILMKLYGEQKFDLDAPLKTYFPKFKKSNKGDLIIRDILAHQARLKPYIVYWAKTLKRNKKTGLAKDKFKGRTFKKETSKNYPIKITDQLFLHKNYKKKIFKYIRKSPLEANEGYKYSGLFFLLLPEIIEQLTGQKLTDYLYQHIYKPVGIKRLVYHPLEHFPLDQIIPTERDSVFRKQLVHGHVHDEAAAMLNGISCNAGLFGNAEDLGKLFQLYLDGGKYEDQEIISKMAIDEFTKCQYCENKNRRGLGFDKPLLEYVPGKSHVAKDASPQSFGHSGFTGTFAWADPTNNLILIFLSNRVYPSRKNRTLYQMDIRPRLQQVVYDYFKKLD